MSRKTIVVLTVALAALCFAAQHENDKARTVTIKSLKYNPAKITVKAGDEVLWINADDNDHTVTSDEKDGFGSDNLAHGDKFRHTFEKKGTFAYHCKYHPRMKGVVVVGD
jgi:plastocyanin